MHRLAIPLLLAWLATPGLTRAAGFDCARAMVPVERAICADPALSALDADMARLYAEALALIPLAQTLRAGQRDFLKSRNDPTASPAGLREAYRNRLEELRQEIDLARAAAHVHDPAELATTCLLRNFEDNDAACTVAVSRPVQAAPGPGLFFQLHTHANRTADLDYPFSGWVIAAAQPDGKLRPILWNADMDAHFAAPVIVHSPAGPLLEVPGSSTGTAVMNAGSLFCYQDGAWREVDTQGWQRDLAARLPRGREIWKGIYPDWVRMRAQSPLWIAGKDGNCCPSGGHVTVRLGLQGDRIVLLESTVSRQNLE